MSHNTQRVRSRFAGAACGGMGRARPVRPDAGPKRRVVDRSTSPSQNDFNLRDFPLHAVTSRGLSALCCDHEIGLLAPDFII